MQYYKVLKSGLELASGQVCLSEHQASIRNHNIQKNGDFFTIVNPIYFKVGETFWYDGNVKGFMDLLEDITPAFEPVAVPEMEQSSDLNFQTFPEQKTPEQEPAQETAEQVKKKK
jgi:hypothetical protein